MRILGIDLAVRAKHRAILADERGQFISPLLKFSTSLAGLEQVYALACQGLAQDEPLAVVLEATDIAWYPVATFFHQRGATVYVVNPRTAADLARFYQRHARSDRLSAQTLARLLVVNPERLDPWAPPGAVCLALKRGCQELERLTEEAALSRTVSSPPTTWAGRSSTSGFFLTHSLPQPAGFGSIFMTPDAWSRPVLRSASGPA